MANSICFDLQARVCTLRTDESHWANEGLSSTNDSHYGSLCGLISVVVDEMRQKSVQMPATD